MAFVLLTCQRKAFLQTSRTGSIETIQIQLASVSIFRATMAHIDLISRNSDYIPINLAYPRILAGETSHKDILR